MSAVPREARAAARGSWWAPARDVVLVARFEVLRALRTWRALALFVLYGVATCGAAYVFVRLVGAMENGLARQLGVPETKVPGAMLDELLQSESFRSMLEGMVGSEHLVDEILAIPILAIFNLWFGFVLIPFFAASASAESIAIDMGSRALRFEALRTGRLELVIGRFLGQLLLTAGATFLAVAGVWVVGMSFMRGNQPVALLYWLVVLSVRTWFFSIPFVGIGAGCSQVTTSPAWSRVMAVGLVSATWLGFGLARWGEATRGAVLADLALQVLPQGWMQNMWEPMGWMVSAAVCVLLGISFLFVGYLRFARRDL